MRRRLRERWYAGPPPWLLHGIVGFAVGSGFAWACTGRWYAVGVCAMSAVLMLAVLSIARMVER